VHDGRGEHSREDKRVPSRPPEWFGAFNGALLRAHADIGELVPIEIPQRLSRAVSPEPEAKPLAPGEAFRLA
jgi:hypothetical protein